MLDQIEYKKIWVDLGRELSPDEKRSIDIINSKFHVSDLFLEYSDTSASAFLNLVNLNRLRDSIFKLEDEMHLAEDNVLKRLFEKILSIGSYGLVAGKRSYVTYNNERKVAGRKQKVENRGSYYYARDNKFMRGSNRVPDEYLNRIIPGDSEEVLKNLPDNCIDLVFTSPPYNFGLDYGSHEDGVRWNSYFDKLFRVFKECIRVTKYGGRIVINVQPLYSDYIPIHHIISDFFMKNRMIWRNEILWEKNNYNAKYTAWGSWKSPSNPYLKYTWEFLEVYSKGSLKHPGDRKRADISDSEFKEWVNARWSIAPERKMKNFGHPAVFPEKLAERVLKLFSFQDDTVLDPFNGVGTTTKVARDLNRKYVGIEISEEYVKTAMERMGN